MLSKLYQLVVRLSLLGLLIWIFPGLPEGGNTTPVFMRKDQCELVILARSDDPYYPLAIEIAAAENAPIAHNLEDALVCQPEFLVWVVSQTLLSDAVMIEFGLAMKGQTLTVSTGTITASTLDGARHLWESRTDVRGQVFIAANAPNPSAHIEGQINVFGQTQISTFPLTKDKFISALETEDYLTFTGHGANSFFRLNEDTRVTSADIPDLNAIVVSTGSCQTVRPWNEDSIALKFADQGAAAYSGFVFSPNEGYLIGEFDGLPFRYTWPGFPIGHVIQVQNRGSLQGFAHFPYEVLHRMLIQF